MEKIKQEKYMNFALNLAKKSSKRGDVPVGAVIVKNDKIISYSFNKKHNKKNCLYHAEILAINKACKKVKNFRLDECDIFVTKEPCLMCMGAILSARIKTIYFGCFDKKFGNIILASENNFNHKCNVVGGVLEKECSELITSFFKEVRVKKQSK